MRHVAFPALIQSIELSPAGYTAGEGIQLDCFEYDGQRVCSVALQICFDRGLPFPTFSMGSIPDTRVQ